MLPRIRYNLAANYLGIACNTVVNILFVPWYLKYLGVEAYGVIGFFTSIQSVLLLLDLGLSQTFNREVAALSTKDDHCQALRDLTVTFAGIYWIIAFFAGFLFVLLAPFFAKHWLNASALSVSSIRNASIVMGFVIVLRWPGTIYSGGLLALQQQISVNLVNSTFAILRGVGSLVILKYISSSLEAFFLWQFLTTLGNTLVFRIIIYRRLAILPNTAHFRFELLKERFRFVAGVSGINMIALALTQVDKLVISKMVSLEEFGYYSLAATLGGVTSIVVSPVITVFVPRITSFIGILSKENQVSHYFHSACQMLALLIIPLVQTVAIYSSDVLLLWTNDKVIAKNVGLILQIFILGSMLNSLMNLPYQMQIAFKRTRLVFVYNSIALLMFVPLVIVLIGNYGVLGGAVSWLALNLSYVIIASRMMFKREIPKEYLPWLKWSVLVPLFTAGAIAGLLNIIFTTGFLDGYPVYRMLLSFSASFSVLSLLLPKPRGLLMDKARKFISIYNGCIT